MNQDVEVALEQMRSRVRSRRLHRHDKQNFRNFQQQQRAAEAAASSDSDAIAVIVFASVAAVAITVCVVVILSRHLSKRRAKARRKKIKMEAKLKMAAAANKNQNKRTDGEAEEGQCGWTFFPKYDVTLEITDEDEDDSFYDDENDNILDFSAQQLKSALLLY